jgi:hypothetical protein
VKRLSPGWRRIVLWLGAILGSLALSGFFLDLNPGIAFRLFTDYPLPQGMTVVRSGAMMTGNLLHLSSFWELRHTPAALDEFLSSAQFKPGIDNATRANDMVSKAMRKPLPRAPIGEGYSRDRKGRDDWLLVMTNRSVSYLITN